ncbi:hypothetical protein HZC30_07435 [Candidatus Woesearchaeota archaeon]|nr:hypothetical protein [Candidatus Woesearchaeota archaeon]
MPRQVYYVNGERKITFAQFLREEKERREVSWPELSAVSGIECRISAYAQNNSRGCPDTPPLEKLKVIVDKLGYRLQDFEVVSGHAVPAPAAPAANYKALREIAINSGVDICTLVSRLLSGKKENSNDTPKENKPPVATAGITPQEELAALLRKEGHQFSPELLQPFDAQDFTAILSRIKEERMPSLDAIGTYGREKRLQGYKAKYNHPAKTRWREIWKEFIQANLELTPQNTREKLVLCLPGPEALEVLQVYDALGIPQENITGLEREFEVYEMIKSLDLGIELKYTRLYSFLEDASTPFDIVMLDFDGPYTKGKSNYFQQLAERRLLNPKGSVLGVNFFRKEMNLEEVLGLLDKNDYSVKRIDQYKYKTVNGNWFYSDMMGVTRKREGERMPP